MRTLHKSWKDKRHGYQFRIRWYQGTDVNDIRLSLEDSESRQNVYPRSLEAAQEVWQGFKANAQVEQFPVIEFIRIWKTRLK